jgi:hypothetical protein
LAGDLFPLILSSIYLSLRIAGCGGWLGQIHSREDVGEERVTLAEANVDQLPLAGKTRGQENR